MCLLIFLGGIKTAVEKVVEVFVKSYFRVCVCVTIADDEQDKGSVAEELKDRGRVRIILCGDETS